GHQGSSETYTSLALCPLCPWCCLLPNDLIRRQYRSSDARSHVMTLPAGVAHRDHATVAAAEAASHDPLDRYLARPAVFHCRPRGGGEHSLGSARVQHH